MIHQAKSIEELSFHKNLNVYIEHDRWTELYKVYDVMYSGSFNPLHAGHLDIVSYLENQLKLKVIFEVCITRFDKPELTCGEIYKIKNQFDGLQRPVVFTRFATFLSKSYFSIGMKFAVGTDTILRINDTKYYFGSEDERNRVFQRFNSRRLNFLVFPREGYSLEIHPDLKKLCTFIDFTPKNISSSQLRKEVV